MLPEQGQYVNIHAHRVSDSEEEWVLTNLRIFEYPPEPISEACYSVGLHPWDISEGESDIQINRIKNALDDKRVLAVGETGIDKVFGKPFQLQEKIFRAQIELAIDAGMPVIIHAVRSYQEMIGIIRKMKPPVPMIIHGFTGGYELADSLVSAGFHVSVGAALLHSDKVVSTILHLEPEHFYLETDESDIPVAKLYEKVASLKKLSISGLRDHMIEKTARQFERKH